jgi:hypothetical protein
MELRMPNTMINDVIQKPIRFIYSSFAQRTSRSRERELSRERASTGTGGEITGCTFDAGAFEVDASAAGGGLLTPEFNCMILSSGK